MNKRLIVMLLSLSTILFYGWALGAMFNYAAGVPQPLILAGGLAAGTLCAVIAVYVWSKR
ncbi:MAG: hypothetical protein KBS54_05890 [Synergistaceae bacterium]|nr:hypothetical protein [Candidatus Equadaptatus faecalis]